jgi:hypothetical protein
MTFLCIAAYLVAWLVTARIAYVIYDKSDPSDDDDNRFTAMLLGAVWPIVLVWVILSRGLQSTVLRETKAQRERRAAQESRTRDWETAKTAREFGLPVTSEQEGLLHHVTPKIDHNCFLEGCVKREPQTRKPRTRAEERRLLDEFPFTAQYDAD